MRTASIRAWRPSRRWTAIPGRSGILSGSAGSRPPCPTRSWSTWASREITGFTHLTRPASGKNGNIKDYEVYLSDKPEAKKPLAKGTPVAKGTFENEVGESVVKFEAPVKGRYFRLRALSNINGQPTWAGIGELTLHCKGVKFVGKPWPRETSEGPKGPGSKLTGLSSTEELWVIKDGVLDKKALTPGATKGGSL